MKTDYFTQWIVGLCIALIGQGLWAAEKLPNILWITSEDNGPHLGAYGDTYATTPHLDALAGRGMIYLNAWSTAPVCAPARTTLISGVYPTSTGSQHMRSESVLPPYMKMYPQYLREAGYYCTNNSKEDYNLTKPGQVWDESSRNAHWKNRNPGQPFFAIFNHTTSHESQVRRRPHTPIHDPSKAPLPAYHPDTPESRRDWAQYYDKLTEMDAQAGANLKEIEEARLAEDTIIFYYGDHGVGLPRGKRWPFNSGLRVPLIVYFPEKYRHLAPSDYQPGGQSSRLVGFIDFAPTLLSMAGIKPPSHMQGLSFAGLHQTEAPDFIYGFRGRMDERIDMVRVVRDERFLYIRNYMPHRIYGQYVSYMFETPTTQVWHDLYHEGKLAPPQTYFWETKPMEELYDLENDQDEVNNLARDPAYIEVLQKLRQAQRSHAIKIRDLGFLPEGEIHDRADGYAPYDMGHDDFRYPLTRIMRVAEMASSMNPRLTAELVRAYEDPDSAVRFWAVQGLLMRGEEGARIGYTILKRAINDPSPYVRSVAAEALGRFGNETDINQAVTVLMEAGNPEKTNNYAAILALNALDYLEDKAAHVRDQVAALPATDGVSAGRSSGYVNRLKQKILSDLDRK